MGNDCFGPTARAATGRDVMNVILSPAKALSYTRQAIASSRNRAQPGKAKQQVCTTGSSPQTNHIKNITSFFPDAPRQLFGSARPARHPMGGDECQAQRASLGVRPRESAIVCRDRGRAGAKSIVYAHGGGGVMRDQDELDAMTKAWTYAVLDALEAADEKTRLEIVRILCPAGFAVVPTAPVEPSEDRKN